MQTPVMASRRVTARGCPLIINASSTPKAYTSVRSDIVGGGAGAGTGTAFHDDIMDEEKDTLSKDGDSSGDVRGFDGDTARAVVVGDGDGSCSGARYPLMP